MYYPRSPYGLVRSYHRGRPPLIANTPTPHMGGRQHQGAIPGTNCIIGSILASRNLSLRPACGTGREGEVGKGLVVKEPRQDLDPIYDART